MQTDLSPETAAYLKSLVEDGRFASEREALDAIVREHAETDLERVLGMSREEIRKSIEDAEASGMVERWEPLEERLQRYKRQLHAEN